ncbi:hypothetical protein [Tautonia sociabilis]|uniref:Uncharacterized protein n=1 Tax=Tautonia sociabilis TaxID=2080755 RepID=A0A432MS13_9BACT|nr:hypothetical protein [Tautonia sociabilis]RUL89658.1 hypothetical protein TsocGM_00350 [Tautonia sociabilis]
MNALAPSPAERACRAAMDPPVDLDEIAVSGTIVDSWVEPAGSCDWDSTLVLQVVTRDRPRELVTVEAEAVLVPDLGWLADLGENLCHGSPVRLRAQRGLGGELVVTFLVLDR